MQFNGQLKALATVLVSCLLIATPAHASKTRVYEVTITNITQAIYFTPILAATHNRAASFFDLGQPASEGLAELAESGGIATLRTALDSSRAVSDTETNGALLMAGETATITIEAKRWQRLFSMAGMLLPTNDGFVALDSVALPHRGSRVYYAKGYDAGSELNDQLCQNIPGPRCQGEGISSADGEGFVHIHNGIHEQGDLPGGSAALDWKNPVAEVTIRRIR